ncbi:MAG: LssY C-terminal domain-containing protein [Acidobacteriota bacterium]|nr:LssY C-terminal domain-containing protein [Acidobacteriota bacterium]
MNTPVASWSSPVDTPISAVLIAPVLVNSRLALPVGSILSGRIKSVTRVGLGIRHERASLGMEFTSLVLPGGGTNSFLAHVAQVDNGRERVVPAGLVQGIRATGSISYRVSGYIKTMLLWHFHAELAEWAIKSLVVQLPEPEIYYPAGTELTLVTKQLLSIAPTEQTESADDLANSDLVELQRLVAVMPFRTSDPESGRLSDVTNVLLAGTRSQIVGAFRAAGWGPASPLSVRSRIGYIRAAAEMRGYSASMNSLLLNGAEADMCWQKGFNDVSKRHHIRVWRQPQLWNGQALWIAAATRDVDFAYLRPGRTFTHRIDPRIDEEREKVAYDLAFTSCASPVSWIERSKVPSAAQNGTGDAFVTDTRLVIVRLRECLPNQRAVNAASPPQLITRGGKWQRLVRREILMARNDLMRSNPYWRMGEAAGRAFAYARRNKRDVPFGSLATHFSQAGASPRRQALSLAFSSLQ